MAKKDKKPNTHRTKRNKVVKKDDVKRHVEHLEKEMTPEERRRAEGKDK